MPMAPLPMMRYWQRCWTDFTEPTIIYFPSGDYLFEDQIALPSGVVLRGNGADHTTLIFDLAAEKDLIAAKGSAGAVTVSIIGAPAKGNSVVKVSDPPPLSWQFHHRKR